MSRQTSDDYSKAIRARYLRHRTTLHEGMLAEPSNARIRDLCVMVVRGGLPKPDEKVFLHFFMVADAADLERTITWFDIEKFRPMLNFLIGRSQTTDLKNLNLIAVLIDFPDRPLPKFLQVGTVAHDSTPSTEIASNGNTLVSPPTLPDDRRKTKRYLFLTVVVLGIGVVLSFIFFKPGEGCMVWQKDHYIQVDCQASGFEGRLLAPMDRKQIELKKLKVSKDYSFFVKGIPQVWYLKSGNHYEFFNQPGYHPCFTHKKLNVVTPYIAMKVRSGEIKID